VLLARLPEPMFEEEGTNTRLKYAKALAWPEDLEAIEVSEQQRSSIDMAAAMGAAPPSDADFARAWEARQLALAERERMLAEAEAPA
jgi:hypothetical protein